MRVRAGRLMTALLALAATSPAGIALAQPQVAVSGPPDSGMLRHLTPSFTIAAAGFPDADPVAALRLQVSSRADFSAPLLVDTTIASPQSVIRLPRPLPEDTPLYWRASARSSSGVEVQSAVIGPRATVPWLTLRFPNEPNGTTVNSRQPALAWSSGTVDSPPGPWRFEVAISNAATRQVVVARIVTDTSFVPPTPLEANTPYRWRVTARLGALDSASQESSATFVIADTDAPRATLLYQSFPNPFPTASAQSACIWFDLHQPSLVTLEVFDIHGALVRRLVPGPDIGSTLPAGRYGRESRWGDTGCDTRFAWDGLSDDGRVAPAGVYLVRMRAGEQQLVKKILFRGR